MLFLEFFFCLTFRKVVLESEPSSIGWVEGVAVHPTNQIEVLSELKFGYLFSLFFFCVNWIPIFS